MSPWLIPMIYTIVGVVAGVTLPRLEHLYLAQYTGDVSVSTALAFFSTVAAGMMSFIAIVFAIGFVMIQFAAVAYSPRIVVMFASSPRLFHALGLFFATFCYALASVVWIDRGGSGRVPLLSSYMVAFLAVLSLLVFARLIQGLEQLQIHNVLQQTGAEGRKVIRTLFPRIGGRTGDELRDGPDVSFDSSQAMQTVTYSGEPLVIARYDIGAFVRLAETAGAVLVLECGVGETLLEDTVLLHVYGAVQPLPEAALMRAVHLKTVRTFEQDPKYAIRLLVDVAIRALSPAVNDPTTAVQALDQIEDLLRRLGRRRLDTGRASDATGTLRVIFPTPTWQDYLALSFDEIGQYGETSLQVMRRLRSALVGLADTITVAERRAAVQRYLGLLTVRVGRSSFDDEEKVTALEEDRQGLGLSRKRKTPLAAPQEQRPAVVPG